VRSGEELEPFQHSEEESSESTETTAPKPATQPA
jgi:hypothetical protein